VKQGTDQVHLYFAIVLSIAACLDAADKAISSFALSNLLSK
jgi:hypothetical protein